MRTFRKKEIFKAMKFQTIKNTKFYSSEIKWFYIWLTVLFLSLQLISQISLLWLTVLFFPIRSDQSVMAYCVVFSYQVRSLCHGLMYCFIPFRY